MLSDIDSAELPADAIEVGYIMDAWGVKGWFKVRPHSADPEALFSSRQWYLQPSDRSAPQFTGTLKLRLKEAKEHSGGVVASAHAIEDRGDAERLRGAKVFVARSSFPSTATDEFYWVDLVGLDVINREGVLLGTVAELLSSTAQAVLVVQATVDGKVQEHLIPFVAAWVDGVDLKARRITVDWQSDY